MKVPARPGTAPARATDKIVVWLRRCKNFFAAFGRKRGPANRRASKKGVDWPSALDERTALGLARGFRRHREALTLAGVQALAGIRGALARALALAGVGGDALALGGVGGVRHGRHDGPGKEQRGGGSSERGTRLGIQLHNVLLNVDDNDAVSLR